MPQAETAVERLALAHRENAGGGGNPAVANDHATIVQRRFGMENREKQFDGKMRIDHDAGFFVDPDRGIALDRDQRAELFVRQLHDRFRDVMNRLAFLTRKGKDRVAAQLGQAAPQFRLEDHHERHRQKNGEAADDPADHDKIQQLRDQGQRQENDRKSGQHLRAARPAKIEIAVIDADAEQNDLEETSPAVEPKLENLLHHFATASKSASVTRKAAAFSLTS